MRTYSYKLFKHNGTTYRFKEPLKVQITNFICYDLKTKGGELSIPCIRDGYTRLGEITNPEKEIKEYLTHVFDNYLAKKDDELDVYEREYKQKFIDLLDLRSPKERRKKKA